QIQFDENDIPHIKAKSQSDAFYALGFLHATERSWQLELSRRLASGRLSEILGERTVSLDRFLRTLGIKYAAEKQYERYPTEIKQLIKAYADGVNAGNQSLGWALPIEYFLTGSQPGHWSPTDSVAWSLMMALDLGDNWQKELFRLELSQYLTTAQIWDVMPPYPGNAPVSNLDFAKLYKELGVFKQSSKSSEKQSQNKQHDPYLLQSTDLQPWISDNKEGLGSNNWVLAGKKTVSGKPLLANDPHLGLSAPSTWYFAHLEAPGLNVIGATLPGIPAVVLGRTTKIAWGFTNTGPDVQDLYLEKIDPNNPNQYIGPDGPLSFLVREEIIQIKDKPPLRFVVKQSQHGPIISDSHARAQKIIDSKRFALALRWTALDTENQTLLGGIMMNRADSMESFKSALRYHYAPMQTVAIADTQGNIALQVAGTTPRRQPGQGLYGVAPALGWERSFDWVSYLPFEQLPSAINPDSGWLASANQQIIS
ncbi:MAG: penicillin acylase family protein, partial [Burkholderiaceae bacterium]|nr:penicillin acylase family protein [Burkholderiaceae bacterium]